MVAGNRVRLGGEHRVVYDLHTIHRNKHHAAPNHNVGASNHHHFDIDDLYHDHNINGAANINDRTATANHHVASGDNDNLCRPHRSTVHFHDSTVHLIFNFHHHIFNLHNCSGHYNNDNRTTNLYDCCGHTRTHPRTSSPDRHEP